MRNIEDNISIFVQNQFPAFYQEEGPNFIAFVKEYYKYLQDTNNPLYYSRNLIEYRDVDKTLDQFVVHFKEKYLKYFPLELAVEDTRFLVKHIMDFYRSKGSERSYEIFFKSVYNTVPEIYYPKDDLFKLSDGTWYKPVYLELLPGSVNLQSLVQKQIIGSKSGATAFVESIISKRISGRFVDIVYLSSTIGTFEAGEVITIQSNPIINGYPRVLGSLSSVDIITGGENFVVGDLLEITTGSGQKGILRVTSIATETGVVNFTLVDGGFGYTNTASVLVSSKVLSLTGNSQSFTIFETLYQPLANIAFSSANGTLAAGDVIESFNNSDALIANAVILSINYDTGTSGTMLVSTITGNVAAGTKAAAGQFYKHGNTITALTTAYTNVTATGNIIASNATSIGVININNTFVSSNNNYIFGNSQSYANGSTITVTSSIAEIGQGTGATFKIGRLTNPETVRLDYTFLKDKNTGNVALMDVRLDAFNSNTTYPVSVVNTAFNAFSNVSSTFETINFASANTTYSYGAAVTYSTAPGNTAIGGLANNTTYYINFANSTSITLSETFGGANVNLTRGSNETGHYLVGPLPGYGFVKYPGGDKDTTLLECFQIDDFTIGTISTLVSRNGGQNYTKPPFVKVYDPKTAGYDKRDLILSITGATRNFSNGELLQQTSTSPATVLTINTFSVAKYSFNSNTNVQSSNDVIVLGSNATRLSVNAVVKYTVSPGNTVVSGLTNNSIYYVSFANTTAIALASSQGGSNINITGAGTGESGHFIEKYITAVTPDEFIYQSNGSANVATGYVHSSSINSTGYGTITIRDVTGTFVSNSTVNTVSTVTTVATSTVESVNASATITVTGKAIIDSGSNTNVLYIKRLTFFDTFAAGNTVIGADSGATATITYVTRNEGSLNIGNNAVITTNVIVANGTVTGVEIYNSGFGHIDDEVVTAVNMANNSMALTVKTFAQTQGTGQGYYKGTKGFVSGDKYLHDGDYYQNFSYDIKTSIPFDKYKDVLKQVIHVAGTKVFGTYQNRTDLDLTITSSNTEINY